MIWRENNSDGMKYLDNIGKLLAVPAIVMICCVLACEKRSVKQSERQSGTTVRQVTETLLFEIPWGSKKGLVGFLPHTESYEDQGPTSFFVDNERRLFYVLDTVNRRVNVYEGGKFIKEIKLTSGYYPTDIFVNSDIIYLLTDMTIEKLSREGDVLKIQIIVGPGYPLRRTEKIFKVGGTIVILSNSDTRTGDVACFDHVSLETRSCESLREIYANKVIDSDLDKIIAYRDGNLVYVKGNVIESIGPRPFIEEIYPPSRLFRVSNGNVYVMRPTEKGVSFYVQE